MATTPAWAAMTTAYLRRVLSYDAGNFATDVVELREVAHAETE